MPHMRAAHKTAKKQAQLFAVGIADSGGGSADAPNPGAGGAHTHRPGPGWA